MADGKHICESQAVMARIKRHAGDHAKCEQNKWFITGKKINGILSEICTLCGDVLKTHTFYVPSKAVSLFEGGDGD
jgi:hypothetical protein